MVRWCQNCTPGERGQSRVVPRAVSGAYNRGSDAGPLNGSIEGAGRRGQGVGRADFHPNERAGPIQALTQPSPRGRPSPNQCKYFAGPWRFRTYLKHTACQGVKFAANEKEGH